MRLTRNTQYLFVGHQLLYKMELCLIEPAIEKRLCCNLFKIIAKVF